MKYKKSILAVLVGTSLVLSGCGGGGGGSPESSHTATAKPGKLQRHALKAEDISTAYDESNYGWQTIVPKLDHRMGTATYAIIESEPQDMASINPASGTVTVFKPGTLTVKVTDTSAVYENSETTFTVTIDKGEHKIQAEDREIFIEPTAEESISPRDTKGSVSYEVAEESRHLLDIDRQTGKLIPLAIGQATVIISDEGDDKFKPASTTAQVTITAIPTSGLGFIPLSTSYSPGLILEPKRFSEDDASEYRYRIKPDADPDVITIDETTGLMTVNKIGQTVVEVTATYDDHHDPKSQTATFGVSISEGLRLDLKVDSQTFSYAPGKIIQPNYSHAITTPRYTILNGGNVIKIDEATGYLQIIGVGGAYLKAIDDGNPNYHPQAVYFTLKVEKGEHPGLEPKTVIQRTYSEDLTITPHIAGQYGDLSITGTSANIAISDDEKSVTVIKASTTNLSVTDSGGLNYNQSPAATVVLDIARAIHPAMTVKGLTTDYTSNCFAIDNLVTGAKGQIAVTTNSNPAIAEYDAKERCIRPLKAGSTDLTLYSQQSDNYEVSKTYTLPVIINKAGTTLKPSGDVWGIFGGTPIDMPDINGQHGDVQFELAENAPADVVEIDADNNEMKMLNAGTTRIKVTDSGSEQHQGATAYFSVTVKQAPNMLGVSYPTDEIFVSGKRLTPTFTDLADGMATTFELTSSTGSAVKLVNANTGELEIQSAGDYSLKVTAVSRNYRQKELTVRGTIDKAPHPGITTEPIEIEYSPLNTYQLTLDTPAIGKRVFSVADQDDDLVSIDPNSGKLTLLDFTENRTQTTAIVRIGETDGDQNHYPLTTPAVQQIIIKAPNEGVSHKDITIEKTGSIFESRLNSEEGDYRFRNLKGTKVSFAGARVGAANDRSGVHLIISMLPEGEEDTLTNRKQILVYVQRFDGCPDKYNRNTVSNGTAEPVAMSDFISCGGEDTNRYLTFKVIDDQHLTAGNWQAVTPFVVYRQSDRPFKPTAVGGCYQGNYDGNYHGCFDDGLEEPSTISEWNRVDVRISK